MDKSTRDIMFSSGSDEYETPLQLFNTLDKVFSFTLDPCASDSSHMVDTYYTKEDNGLAQDWDHETVFINPPYSDCATWLEAAASHAGEAVVLVPARTETRYFHNYVWGAADYVLFLKGRLKFINRKTLSYVVAKEVIKDASPSPVDRAKDLYRTNHPRGKAWSKCPSEDKWEEAFGAVKLLGVEKATELLLPPSSAPFPSVVVFFTSRLLCDQFQDLGHLVRAS